MLSDGQIAERGNHDELVAQPQGIYHRMWNAQLKSNSEAMTAAGDDDQ